MPISRRSTLKLGLGAGALPLLGGLATEAHSRTTSPGSSGEEEHVAVRPVPLESIRLAGGPLKHAQDLNGRYLKSLEPDRMLAYYRERAGLEPRAQPYGGWDGGGRNLTGHIAGHYLSSVSLMWAATGDSEFKDRADYLVGELALVADAQGDGYLGAIEGCREAFARLSRGDIESRSFDLNGLWSPWYTLHKTYAGLRDAWRYTGNRQALELEIAFAAWAEGVLSGLDDAQLQHMLNTEIGGMNDVLVDLYRDTGDERWLALSYKFEHDDFLEPLRRHQDNLAGKHGNTAVPKLLGSANRYLVEGRADDLVASAFFWDTVVSRHTFCTGGHGKDEYFGPPGTLSTRVDGRTAETCNIYNMLKLTRVLFSVAPDARLADFHERALYNHILGSMDPEDGSTCYMVPVGRNVEREYQRMYESFTCCVGTGMESHALHGGGMYYETADRVFVNLYAPSTADCDIAGVRLTVDTDFPLGDTATIRVGTRGRRELTLSVRRPHWAGDGFSLAVNGKPVDLGENPHRQWRDDRSQYDERFENRSSFVDITREWQSGDEVRVRLPKSTWLEPTPDDPRRAALMWGPLALAGDLGDEGGPVPVLVAAERPVDDWLEPVNIAAGEFRAGDVAHEPDSTGRPTTVDLKPFYRLHRRRYTAYWDLCTEDEWQARKAGYAAEEEAQRKLEAATVAFIRPGDADSERAFDYQGGDDASTYRLLDRPARRARSWFSYVVPVEADEPMTLILDLYSDDRRHSPAHYSILVNGRRLADGHVEMTEPPRFYAERYPIPPAMLAGRGRATIRFEAHADSQTPAILGVRVVRSRDLP